MIFPQILPILTHIINFCITTSSFPLCWKLAKVIPVPKTSHPSSCADFRPISILPCLSKVFEKVLAGQISNHISRNNLLSPVQSGFRSGHSCATAMVKVLDDIRIQYDLDKLTILCLLDFSKAFDRVNHDILCEKLKLYFGFSRRSLRLVQNYLRNRRQRVKVGDQFSEFITLLAGVPQGSILGPILFCMFINDLTVVCLHVLLHLYADDVQLYLSRPFNLLEDLISRLNDDLLRIYNWTLCNGLTLNPSKSQLIAISKKKFNTINLSPVFISQFKIDFVENVTSLGFKINRSLSAIDHVNLSVGRIYGGLRKLNFFSKLTPVPTRLRLVKTLLLPIIDYSAVVYCKLDSHSQHKLLVVFNSMIRYVFGFRRFDHVSQYHQLVLGCPFNKFIDIRCCIFMHKIIQTKVPSYLFDKFCFAQSTRTMNLITPNFKYLNSSRLFFVYAIRLWNSLPITVKQIVGKEKFKRAIITTYQ